MNETIRTIMQRRSVRAFTDEKISKADRQTILEAAFRAPTAGNQQLYTIIDITDQNKKETLAELCDGQPFVAKAKLVLIFLADALKWHDAYKSVGCQPRALDAGDLMLSVSDANIAAENAVIAAESLGIGSCYIGDIMERCEELRSLLSLPPYVFPACMLVFGYPTERVMERPLLQRIPERFVVFENGYHRLGADELRAALEWKAGNRPYEEWLSAFCERKYNSDFSCEMSRSVRVYLDDYLKTAADKK